MNWRNGVFRSVNSVVVLAYSTFVIVCVMVSFEPILAAIAYLASLGVSTLMDGVHKTLKRLSWQLPTILVFMLINCIFVQRGETLLLELGPFVLHLESLVYGLCIGLMIMCAMNYFTLLSEAVSTDEALSLFSGKAPVISLVTSMSLELVPKFQKQERELREVDLACTCANAVSGKSKHAAPIRHLTHLLVISLEDSFICADSMRARGWGFSTKRTTYKKERMTNVDKVALSVVAIWGIICVIVGYIAASSFQFYPQISVEGFASADTSKVFQGLLPFSQVLKIGLVFYVAYFLLPYLVLFMEVAKWKR